MRVDYSARSGGLIGIFFFIFFNMKVCCMFSLESPHRGDSNEYTQYTIFNMKKKNTLNYPKSAAMGFFPKGHKNELETAMVNEPEVFEPLKFYCKISVYSTHLYKRTGHCHINICVCIGIPLCIKVLNKVFYGMGKALAGETCCLLKDLFSSTAI